jgi:hypothetical protein
MTYASDNPTAKTVAPATLALLALSGVGIWYYAKKKREEEDEALFLALAAEVEMEDFDPLSLVTKGAGLFGDFKVVGLKSLKTSGTVEDDLGDTHKYTGGKAWLVDATVHGDPVLLLVRRNGSVELLEG